MALIEGATRLPIDADQRSKGPAAKQGDAPFYNPAMALNRDLSVLLVAAEARRRGRELDVADVLAGTGARSLRLANEVDAPLIVHANDADPHGLAVLQQGARELGVQNRIRAVEGPARRFLADRRYDIVDVDPFGSPMPFLDAAVQATRHDGIVCLTATDTGALSGTYPKACRRRYGAEPFHATSWRQEVGLRILQANVVRAAGRTDRAAEPVFAVARGHWMRVAMRIKDGRAAADRASRCIGHVASHPRTGQGVRVDSGAGPAWWGALHDGGTLEGMAQEPAAEHLPDAAHLVDVLAAEADLPPYWVPLERLPGLIGGDGVPKRRDVLRALADQGASAALCHMDPHGIRTDADAETVEAVWRSLL